MIIIIIDSKYLTKSVNDSIMIMIVIIIDSYFVHCIQNLVYEMIDAWITHDGSIHERRS